MRTGEGQGGAGREPPEGEPRWRALFERMNEGFYVGEAVRDARGAMVDYRYIELNPAFERLTGLSSASALGRTSREAIPGLPGELVERYARVLETGEPALFEMFVPALDGRWFEARAQRASPETFAVLFLDVTERRAAVEALRVANAKAGTLAAQQAAILGQLAEGVIVTDPAGRITFVNQAAARLHGVARLDIAPDAYSETYQLYTEDGQPYPPEQLPLARAVIGRETVSDARWRIRRPDGTEVLALGSARPVRSETGEVMGAVLTLSDDTEREAAERSLRESEERLRALNATLESLVAAAVAERLKTEEQLRQAQKMEAVGQLTGGIAHDFNNLLTGIVGSLDLLQRRIEAGRYDNLQRYTATAITSAQRAAALTQRLLAFARRQPLDPRPVAANQLVAGMEDLLRRTLGPAIDLEMVLAGGLWLTLCDPNQLESAILNLAINARDAMPAGGRLTVETANTHLDDAYARSTGGEVLPGAYVAVCVTDTGSGMTAEVAERAFEPFFTTKPIGQGTGLGLSMLYGFIKQSSGHVKIYSEPERGTTFKVYLPRHSGPADVDIADGREPRPADEPPAPGPTGHVVLVVEDEASVRLLITETLADLGHVAIEASDGPSGLSVLQSSRRIDLLITDVGLPGLNGRQLADAARERRPDLKVLFITGYAGNAAVGNGVLEPGTEMLTKPFALDVLAAKVGAILGRGRVHPSGRWSGKP